MYLTDYSDANHNDKAKHTVQSDDQQASEKKTRVVVFGSFYRGYHILSNLLNDAELMKKIEIVGVATDDVKTPKRISLEKRVWRHPHTAEEEVMVERLAQRHGIPVFKGKVKSQEFYNMLQNEWKPDIIYMGTFGQRLDNTIIETPPLGTYNAHPSDGVNWPSCVGPNPFEQMFENGTTSCAVALHHANDKFDDGQFACFSEKIDIPYDKMAGMSEGEKVVHMHRITSPYAAAMINSHLRSQIGMPLVQQKWASKTTTPSHPEVNTPDVPAAGAEQKRVGYTL